MTNSQTEMISRILGVLSLIATITTFAAAVLQQIAPEYAVYALALSAAIAAFTARVQGNPVAAQQRREFLGIGGDFMVDMAAAAFLKALAKNKRKARSIALRVFRAIKAAFPEDPDFE